MLLRRDFGVRSFLHEYLNFAVVILDFDEGEFAEGADGGDAAGEGDGFFVVVVKMVDNVADFGVAEGFGRVGVDALGFNFFEFAEALGAIIV